MKKMQDDILKVLLSQQEIADKVCEIGKQITKDYEGKNLLMVSVLKGSVVFMADLMRAVDTPGKNRLYVGVQLRLGHQNLRRGQNRKGPRHESGGL